jgi:hypothetical protein
MDVAVSDQRHFSAIHPFISNLARRKSLKIKAISKQVAGNPVTAGAGEQCQ